MPEPIFDREKYRRALEEIIGPEAAKYGAISDDALYRLKADEFFLAHILDKADVRLSNHTHRSIVEELEFWDRAHLVDLAQNIEVYTTNPKDNSTDPLAKEKLKYIIEHSIRGDLVQALVSGNPDDKFASYNSHVLTHLRNQGLKVDVWLTHGGNLRHTPSLNPHNPFSIETIQWKRDFRSEYAIGNISQCCISVDGNPDDLRFKKILLDYFLDMSVQVLHVKKTKDAQEEKIGQIYLMAFQNLEMPMGDATSTQAFGPCLGLGSLEFAAKHRGDPELDFPVIDAIIGHGGYREIYGFESAFIGHKLALFDAYIKQRKNDVSRMLKNVLKQKRQNFSQDKDKARRSQLPATEVQERLDQVNEEIRISIYNDLLLKKSNKSQKILQLNA